VKKKKIATKQQKKKPKSSLSVPAKRKAQLGLLQRLLCCSCTRPERPTDKNGKGFLRIEIKIYAI
jgi:hypothetical protein